MCRINPLIFKDNENQTLQLFIFSLGTSCGQELYILDNIFEEHKFFVLLIFQNKSCFKNLRVDSFALMSVSGHMYIVNSSFACPTLSAQFCSFAVSDSLQIFFLQLLLYQLCVLVSKLRAQSRIASGFPLGFLSYRTITPMFERSLDLTYQDYTNYKMLHFKKSFSSHLLFFIRVHSLAYRGA